MTIELPQFPDQAWLTHSSVQTYATCPRKYFLNTRLGLRVAHDSESLRIGSMWHEGVGAYESGSSIDEAIDAVRNAYADTDCPPYLQPDDYAVERETVVAMVRGHHHRWMNDAILETVAVELAFEVPIINPETGRETPTYRSAGKIDRIARLPDGRLALVERKTTSENIEPGANYYKTLMMDNQISRYFLAARAIGHPVETTIYDVLKKPAIRPKAISKADRTMATAHGHYFGVELVAACPERETPELYGARLLADMAERPDFYFSRVEVPRLDCDLREYEREQWITQQNIRNSELNERKWGAAAWPRNTRACLSPYQCQFLDCCRGLKGDPTEEVPQGFRRAERLHEELESPTLVGVGTTGSER